MRPVFICYLPKPDTEIEPESPALAGGFFTAEPPGSPTEDLSC